MFKFFRAIIAIVLLIAAIFSAISGLNNNPSCAEIASRLLLRNEDKNENASITISMTNQNKPMLVRGIVKPVREWIEHLWRNCTSYSIQWQHSEGKIVVTEEAEFRFIVGLDPTILGITLFLLAAILLLTLRGGRRRACA